MIDKDFQRFSKNVQIPNENGCMEWKGAKNPIYGTFKLSDPRRTEYAHRLVYEHFIGPIPKGLQIDHLCGNPSCVNPSHLEPVTQHENALRGLNHNLLKTHCPHGHPYLGDNLIINRGYRICQTCHNERRRKR